MKFNTFVVDCVIHIIGIHTWSADSVFTAGNPKE